MTATSTAPGKAGLTPLLSASRIIVLAVFVVSRILYGLLAGVRYDASSLQTGWQYIDPILMKTRLLESLFYLHMQPPGFNLVLGIVLKLFPDSYVTALQIGYLVVGVAIALSLLHLMKLLGVSVSIATVLTSIFIINPGVVLYENSAMYEYPIALLLLLSAITLFRFCQSPGAGKSLAFFGLLLALAMIRNIFHPLFVLMIVGLLMVALPKARRLILTGAIPVLLCILALQTKNWILFRSFTTSTWAGMNTGVVTTFQLAPEEASSLIGSGLLTPIAAIPPFSELKLYAPFIQPVPPTGIPVLDNPTAAAHPNFNNKAYLQVHPLYVENAKAIWLHHPAPYIKSVAIAWFAYFLPSSELHNFDPVRPSLQPFDRLYNAIVFGKFRQMETRKGLRALFAAEGPLPLVLYTGMFLMIGLPVLVGWLVIQLWRRQRWTPAQRYVLGFMLVTILFSTGVSNLLSSFENDRYRFPLDSFYTVIAGLAITSLAQRRRIAAGTGSLE